MPVSPIADVRVAPTAHGPAAALPTEANDERLGRVARPLTPEAGPTTRRTTEGRPGNVIELEPLPLRRTEKTLASPMARINPETLAVLVRICDALMALAAGALAWVCQPATASRVDPTIVFAALAVLAMLLRLPNVDARRARDTLRRPLPLLLRDAAWRTLLPFAFTLAVGLVIVPAGSPLRSFTERWLALWALFAVAGVGLVRVALGKAISHWRDRGRLKQAVAIYGGGELAERLVNRLRSEAREDFELIGVFDDRTRARFSSPMLRSVAAGTTDDLIALSRRRDIDRVIIALPHSAEERLLHLVRKLRQMPVEISLAPDQVGYRIACRDGDQLGGLPLIAVHGRPLSPGQILLKSAVDKALALLGVVIGGPLLLAIAAAIKLDSRGPVLFRQNRYGFGDRLIGVYKFRTMVADAADYDGVRQAQADDPRVTRVGRFLRRWSLDELPQLFNVLNGEMSLVGPRPHAVSMRVEDRLNHDIVPDYARRHHVKPGITGWAQVNGFHGPVLSEEQLRARVYYDLEYINNWSLWFDLRILLRTLRIIFGQRHSY